MKSSKRKEREARRDAEDAAKMGAARGRRRAKRKEAAQDKKIRKILSSTPSIMNVIEQEVTNPTAALLGNIHFDQSTSNQVRHAVVALDGRTRRSFLRLAQDVHKKSRKLLEDPSYIKPLTELVRFDRPLVWVNSPATWKPKGKSRTSQFRSLVKHVFQRYTAPQFLYNAFWMDDERLRTRFTGFYIRIARGDSLKESAKREFPVEMTKRMLKTFMQSKASMDPLHAIRSAQVGAWGGESRLAQAICHSRFGRDFGGVNVLGQPNIRISGEEQERAEIMQWFCNQHMLDPNEVDPMIDYLYHVKGEQEGRRAAEKFSMKGRTAESVLRGMMEWHGELQQVRKLHGAVYAESGYTPRTWETSGPNNSKIVWQMVELLNSKELMREGRELKHCIASYGRSIESGRCSIWSLRKQHPYEGESRLVTVEVIPRTRSIVQARGKLNKQMTPVQFRFVSQWASANGLRLNSRV